MTEPLGSPLGSVDKALLALDALAAAGPAGAPLGALADRLGLHKASLHRTLAALRYRGYAEQTPDGSYRLGMAATALAATALAEEDLAALLHPVLVTACEELGELTHLGARVGPDIVYLDKVEPDRPVRVWSAIGRRRPVATTALGRAILAAAPRDDRELDGLAAGHLPPAALRTELGMADERGFATEIGSNEPGIGCAAVAIVRAGLPVAAVSVTVPLDRVGPEELLLLADRLRAIAGRLVPPPLSIPPVAPGPR